MDKTPKQNLVYTKNEETFELIEIILKEQFTKDISILGRDLLYNGISTIPDIQERLHQPFEEIRNNLIILLQNKLCKASEIYRKDNIYIGYELEIDNILYILLFPKMLYIAKTKFGEYAEMIFGEFMQFGILTAYQIFEQVKNRLKRENKKINDAIMNKIRLIFFELIEGNYISQSKNINYISEFNIVNKNKKDSKNKNKGENLKNSNEINVNANNNINNKSKKNKMEEKSNKKQKRKKKNDKDDDDNDNDNNNNNIPIKEEINTQINELNNEIDLLKSKTNKLNHTNNININNPSQIDQTITNENPYFYSKETDTYYYFFFNYPQFLNDFKIEIVIDFLNQKISPQAGLIASYFLEKNSINSFKTGRTNSFKYNEITSKYKQISIIDIDNIISDPNDFFIKISSDSIILNLKDICKYIQEKTIEQIILQKYSQNHLRIYRLINSSGALDAKNIMDISLLLPKNCNMILNQLFTEGFIQTEMVKIKGTNILFYSVDFIDNVYKVANMSIKMIKNLKAYLIDEIDNYENKISSNVEEQYITKVYCTIGELFQTFLIMSNF